MQVRGQLWAVMAAAVWALLGCGGGQDPSSTAGARTAVGEAPTMRALAVARPAQSRWGPLRSLPLVPAAMANLADGRVMLWSAEQKFSFGASTGRTYFATYDPATDTVSERTVSETGHNMFCPGTTNLADGRLLVNGGISSAKTSLFNPATNQWTAGAPMAIPRGYQANTLLADGSVLTLGGSWSGGVGNKHAEVWTEAAGWRRLSGVSIDPFLSPDPSRNFGGDSHFWLIPAANGRVFHAGPGVNMHWIDTQGNGRVDEAGPRGDDEFSISGTTVMFDAGRILKLGGGPGYDSVNANANSYLIDIRNGVSVRKLAPMAYRRAFHNSVVLPNGQVLVLGGQTYAVGFSDNNSVLVPELWDPATETFTPLPPMAAPRNYHSVALLLPDARVLSAGGGLCGAGCAANHPDLQILTPHYLLNPDGSPATRPVITAAPATVQYGQTVSLSTDSPIASMAMVRVSSTTHTVNNDQRRLSLSFRATGNNRYELDIPSNPGLALPGDWMLFALNADGTPSVARIVRVSAAGAAQLQPVDDPVSPTGAPVSLQPQVTLPANATGVVYSAQGLPEGISINASTGRLSGVPGSAGNHLVRYQVQVGALLVSTEFQWTVRLPGATRFVKLEALSELNGNAWSSAAEVELLGADGRALPRTGWTAQADSQELVAAPNGAANAIDGNPTTIWHTQWQGASPRPPHTLVINLGAATSVAGLRYLPRQDASSNGTMAGYRIWLSGDGQQWGSPVASGDFGDLGSAKTARTVYFGNLALLRQASQSATNGAAVATRATDGNTDGQLANGSVSLTQAEPNAWWEVDLGQRHQLSALRLWNRSDCCAAQLANFQLLASDRPMTGRALAELLADSSVWRSNHPGAAARSVLIDAAGVQARYLRVQLNGSGPLQLAEVQVHGLPLANRAPQLATPATQTSVQGDIVSLTLMATDADGDTLTLSASNLPPGLALAGQTITGVPSLAGRWAVTLVADDGQGGSTATQFDWLVQPATPQFLPVPTANVSAGALANFSAELATLGDYSYQWDFGDGSAPTAWQPQPDASHRYARAGVYQVTVTARTADGRSASRSLWQTVQGSTGLAGRASTAILLEPRGSAAARLWVVNPDNNSISVFNTGNNSRVAEVAVGTQPRTLALAPDGRVWVVNQGSATVSIVSPGTLAVVQTVAMPRASQPFGVVIGADGQGYVSEQATGRVTRITASGNLGPSAAVGLNVRHLAMSADGHHLLALRFITPPQPGEATASVQTSLNNVPQGGEALVLETGSMAVLRTLRLPHSSQPDNTVQGRGVPNYLGAPAISPDGRSAWVPGKQDNIQRGKLRDGQDLDFQNTLRAISARIDLTVPGEDLAARIDHDNSGLATAAAFHPGGAYLFVALETSRHVAVVDAAGHRELFRVDAGRAPQGLVVSDDGLRLYAHNFMDRSVGVYDLAPLVRYGESAMPLLATLSSVATERLPAQVLRGKQLFYDARDTRLSRDGYISCAACHADGGHDGRTWDFTGFGEGLRNTPSLRGRAGAQGALHWSANFDEVQDFEGQIRTLAQGTGLMAQTDFLSGTRALPLGDRKAGLSADLDALAAYVGSLTASDPTPWRQIDGSLTPQASAGRTVFAGRCVSCHGGADFSSSADGPLRNIGTLKPSSGQRLGTPLTGIDPPTLRDVWATAPYLHDGSAAQVEDAVRAHTAITLSATELADVSAFVRQIGREEAAVPPLGPATVRSSPLFGLASGTAFTDAVAAGQVLTGVRVLHWPVMYQLQALALPADLPAHGGSSGTVAEVRWPAGEQLVRVFGRFDANGINQLGITTSTGATYGPGGQDSNPATSTPFDFSVPAGSRIVGFTGRATSGGSGQLTAIGVLYTP